MEIIQMKKSISGHRIWLIIEISASLRLPFPLYTSRTFCIKVSVLWLAATATLRICNLKTTHKEREYADIFNVLRKSVAGQLLLANGNV